MARAQATRTQELLEMVAELLSELGEPIHYKDLTKVITETGLWENPWGAEPDQILYSAMHNDVKKHGTDSRFIFWGGGIFSTALIEGREELQTMEVKNNAKPKDPYSRPGDMPGDAEKRRVATEAAEADKRCGNCSSLFWEGPNICSHEIGSCTRASLSKRWTIFPAVAACPLWRRRSVAQMNHDRVERQQTILEAEFIRLTGRRPSERGKK